MASFYIFRYLGRVNSAGSFTFVAVMKLTLAKCTGGQERCVISHLPVQQASGICQTSDKLTWSHICELVTIDDQLEREFYERECISEGWTVDELHRQKESGLFMRLAVSKNMLTKCLTLCDISSICNTRCGRSGGAKGFQEMLSHPLPVSNWSVRG